MRTSKSIRRDVDKVADIIRDAGGRIVGRTRLQKISYLLELSGLGEGFNFSYRHYGPYSEDLARSADYAVSLGIIKEEEQPASWGGVYSIYSASMAQPVNESSRSKLIQEAASADSIELELAATAAFLVASGVTDAWRETAKRKPEKAQQGRLEKARALYRRLRQIDTPKQLPAITS
jgi:uncharacterized protein